MKRFFWILCVLLSPYLFAQQADNVDFKKGEIQISINPYEQKVIGTISYSFDVLKKTDSIFVDAQQMQFSNVFLNRKKIKYHNDGKKLWLVHNFKPRESYRATFNYAAHPKKAMYFIGWGLDDAKHQIWTQGQGKYTSNWLPSFDDVNEKVEFDVSVTFDKDFEAIANGKLLKVETEDSLKTWHYDMQQPMSSYLLAVAIGKYDKRGDISKSGIPLEMYYDPQDSLKEEPTYRYTKRIFDFFEEEIGVPYPWQTYKQVPIKDFLYAGMENTSVTFFSDSYVIDSITFIDRNYVNVNAHELAHQWFGNLVTAQNGNHHWLQEGFATYYALLAEKQVFGEDYFYWKLYESAEKLMALSNEGKGESLMDPNVSSLTFYEKGAWALHILKERIGKKAFRTAVKMYLQKHRFKNVNTDDFMEEVEQVSGQNLDDFVKLWLQEGQFPKEIAMDALKQNPFINILTAISSKAGTSASGSVIPPDHEHNLNMLIVSLFRINAFYPLKQEIIYQLKGNTTKEALQLYKEAFQTNEIKVRQAIATSLDTIPLQLKPDFESLLGDKSYVTIENALSKLWLNFPQDRHRYLDKTKNLQGFNDKSLRMLWLTLALITSGYETGNKPMYYSELAGYTSAKNHFEVRQNAFQYLFQLQALSDQNLMDLVSACHHHVWQFSKSSRELLDIVLKTEGYKVRLLEIMSELSKKEKEFLLKKIHNQ